MIKVMTGYHQPTTGAVYFNGDQVDHLTIPKPATWVSKPCIRSERWPNYRLYGATSSSAAN